MRADLHIHTTFSDGELTPDEVARRAAQMGLDAFAITDHDECRGFGALTDTHGVTAVAGIELAAQMDGEVHVLGYRIDCSHPGLVAHVEKAANSRYHRACEIVERLRADGYELGMDEVLGACGGDVVGRPHIASVLVNKGYASSVSEAFERYLGSSAPYYVPQNRISVDRAAQMIREAGGFPVLAHPGLVPVSVFSRLMPHLKDMGFWGIEAYHPVHTDGQCIEFESLARSGGLYVTTGSDFHGSATPRVGIGEETRTSRYLERSLLVLLNESEKRS